MRAVAEYNGVDSVAGVVPQENGAFDMGMAIGDDVCSTEEVSQSHRSWSCSYRRRQETCQARQNARPSRVWGEVAHASTCYFGVDKIKEYLSSMVMRAKW